MGYSITTTNGVSIVNGNDFLASGLGEIFKSPKVLARCVEHKIEILESPISERYCHVGLEGKIEGKQIRVSGALFNLDERWKLRVTLRF